MRAQQRAVILASALAMALIGGLVFGCSSASKIELPPPDSGRFLTLEEQRALSSGQLAEYCLMLDSYLGKLRDDIAFTIAMDESLAVVLDSLNAESQALNNEQRMIEVQLQRAKAHNKTTREYVSREGDTLQKIAELFYGSMGEWRRLYEANKSAIEAPDQPLPAGVRLTIPR